MLPPSVVVPPPPVSLAANTKLFVWKRGEEIHRIHAGQFAANQFNPGFGNARFSPIKDAGEAFIPTLYGGDNFGCAALESVFHDLPRGAGMKTYDGEKLKGQVHSVVAPTRDLQLIDLHTAPLKKLGVECKELIDTEKDVYEQTRLWAAAIHTQRPDADGLVWPSRQADTKALMIFGGRVKSDELVQLGKSRPLLEGDDPIAELVDVAETVGLNIIL
ncbi:RES family NAD+ phosphorylase [Xanthomonas sp. NCPPB 2632]|uniref:RES family NAD+ phosphorylase n=1 Tax=Xanthomonas sp. NCPPB 2632 TaxID=3240912 RepID=UPI0035130476